MAQVIDTIIQSSTAPKKTNVLWDDGVSIKRFKDGKWQSIAGSGGGNYTILSDMNSDFNSDF